MKKIESLEALKQAATYDEQKPTAEFFILLKGGFRSTKRIIYFPETSTFDVYSAITDSWEENISETALLADTPVFNAIQRGDFYWCA